MLATHPTFTAASGSQASFNIASGTTPTAGNGDCWNDGTEIICKDADGSQKLPKTYVLASDFTNTTTTLATVLSASVAGSKSYTFQCDWVYQITAATGAIKVGLSDSVSPANILGDVQISNTASATQNGAITANNGSVNGGNVVSLGTNFPVRFYGTLENGASSGTFSFQAALVSTAGSPTLTVKRGSFCTVQ